MPLSLWITVHAVQAVLWLWLLIGGGAERVEGWRSVFVINWFAATWTAEQIRLYALLLLLLGGAWFFAGLAVPALRFHPGLG